MNFNKPLTAAVFVLAMCSSPALGQVNCPENAREVAPEIPADARRDFETRLAGQVSATLPPKLN